MKLLVCGGAGFIGSNFVRQRVLEHGDEVVVLDKLTYAGRAREPRTTSDDPASFVHGAIEDPEAVADAIEGCEAIVNFAAETHVDRSIAEPDAFVTTHALGTYVLLEAARERGAALRPGLHRRGLRLDRGGHVHRGVAAAPVLAVLGDQGGRRPARAAYRHTYGLRGADLPRLEQLRAVPVPGEADPADGAQRAARRRAAGLRRRHAGAQLDLRRGLRARRSATCSSTASPGEVYNVGGPDEAPNIEVVQRDHRVHRRDESLIEYVTDRPGHDRRYSLSSEKVRALGWEPQVRFADGLEHTVAWYRDNAGWWEPIRSGDYRAYYERQYGRSLG